MGQFSVPRDSSNDGEGRKIALKLGFRLALLGVLGITPLGITSVVVVTIMEIARAADKNNL